MTKIINIMRHLVKMLKSNSSSQIHDKHLIFGNLILPKYDYSSDEIEILDEMLV